MSADGSLAPNPYDAVDYPGHAFPDTHPGRLAAIAVLHGLEPSPAPQCRVLELGCGDAANLVPMAYQLPAARFVGIDLAAAPIARGQRAAAALGLNNLELRVLDICDPAAAELGEFDYIIAHGVYSWVPEPVRGRLLALCGALLAPQGIAFVSYLTQPGTQLREIVRQFLLRRRDAASDPGDQVARARALAAALGGRLDSPDPFQQVQRLIARDLLTWADGAIYHDWLAPYNVAPRVTEFVAHAATHGLAFLGEAEYYALCWRLDPLLTEAQGLLEGAEAESVLSKEQLLDELRCRRFRQTLLCRDHLVCTPPTPERALRLAVSSRLRPMGDVAPTTHAVAEFQSPHETVLRTDHPVAKSALLTLHREWPRAVPGTGLLEAARALAGRADPGTLAADADVLGGLLLACAGSGQAELTAWSPPFAAVAGERPRASAVARAELERGAEVTTLRHGTLKIEDPLGRALVRLLDGTRTRAELRAALAAEIRAGRLRLDSPLAPGADLEVALAEGLERSLTGLAKAPLLEA